MTAESYQPTEHDQQRLAEAGLTLAELLTYKRPGVEEMQQLEELLGLTIVDAILMTDLRRNIVDALAQIAPLLLSVPGHPVSTERLADAQARFIRVVTERMSGNPYPGVNFTLDKARQVLETAQSEDWTTENFPSIFNQMMTLCGEN